MGQRRNEGAGLGYLQVTRHAYISTNTRTVDCLFEYHNLADSKRSDICEIHKLVVEFCNK